jgi:uncharacterized protein YqfA (UPF0365 family)
MEVMAMPSRISKSVLERGLDASTAYEIVSIDIAEIDIGENIGARLQTDQAEADTRIARARAEVRRAAAVAFQQEMKAKVAENRAKLVRAEAELPSAIAAAFRAGQLHVGHLTQPQRSLFRDRLPAITFPDQTANPRQPRIERTRPVTPITKVKDEPI